MTMYVQFIGSTAPSGLFYHIDTKTLHMRLLKAAVALQCLHKSGVITDAISKWHTGCSVKAGLLQLQHTCRLQPLTSFCSYLQ